MPLNIIVRTSKLPDLLTANRQSYLSTLEARIFKNDLNPVDPAGSNSQFVEATDTGYAEQTATFGAPYLDGADGVMDLDTLFWTFNHDSGDWTAYGVWFTDPADSDEWVMAARFGTPVPITAAGQKLRLDGTYRNRQIPAA